jgi:hypothetical protein
MSSGYSEAGAQSDEGRLRSSGSQGSRIARARREIESLTIVASILAEDTSDFFNPDGLNRKPAEKELSPIILSDTK